MSVGKALTIADMIAESSRAEKPRPMIRTCSIWRALEVVGDTPTLLILEAIWFGQRRFDSILEHLRPPQIWYCITPSPPKVVS